MSNVNGSDDDLSDEHLLSVFDKAWYSGSLEGGTSSNDQAGIRAVKMAVLDALLVEAQTEAAAARKASALLDAERWHFAQAWIRRRIGAPT
ncbi:MAG: hypothetical protein AB7Q97_01795 [Gammaproteobacteria bacterium]